MIGKLISNAFLCNCNTFNGVERLRQVRDGRVVGRCLECGKRVYACLLFDNDNFVNVGVSEQ